MILLVSNKWDLTIDFVVLELQKRKHAYFRLNTEDLTNYRVSANYPDFALSVKGETKGFDSRGDIRVIWNRRPGKPYDGIPLRERPSKALQDFVSDQWFWWREAFQLMEDVTWVNDPRRESSMESKVRQLALAQKAGFHIPKTIIGNDPDAIRQFAASCEHGIIGKALYAPLIEEDEEDSFIFTSALDEIDVNDDASIQVCPLIVQEFFPNKVDYRVTVVGEALYSVRIVDGVQCGIPLDWRTRKDDINFERCDLPPEIARHCVSYVRNSGLLFGGIDLIEVNGKYYFLELNPNGEWGWLQSPNGIPIAEALCDLFITLDHA
jgi:glutathione synthase/RimK-type ligase-like ATP-grasp enzyme